MHNPSSNVLMPIYGPNLPNRRVIVWGWVAVIIDPLYFAGSLGHSLLLWFGLEACNEGSSLWASLIILQLGRNNKRLLWIVLLLGFVVATNSL